MCNTASRLPSPVEPEVPLTAPTLRRGDGYTIAPAAFLARFLGDTAADEVVTAMVLLDDADAGNGALTLVPGTQRGGSRTDGEPPRRGDPAPVLVAAPAGTVVFFSSRMLRRSDANHSARDRRALLYLFQPAGRPPLDETGPPRG